MFPKLLRVAEFGEKTKVWINETSFIEKTVLTKIEKHKFDAIAYALGFSYEVKPPSDESGLGIRLTNGTWYGMLGMLQRGEVDMVIGNFPIREKELCDEFRCSYPHSNWESTFITRYPAPAPNMAMFLHPFSIQVWFTILAFVSLLLFIFHYLLRKKNSAPNLFTSILGSLVGQAMILTPRRPREYLVLVSWILGSAFLYHFYAAVLLSFVTIPPLQGIRTIEDLANGIKAGKYECATFPNTGYSNAFIATESSATKEIGYNLKTHKNVNFVEYLEESGGDKKPVFVGLRPLFLPYKDHYYLPEDNFLFFSLAYVTRKDFCCGSELDKAVHRVWASGIFKKIDDEWGHSLFLEFSKEYSKNWNDSPSETQLTMALLKGPFIFLIASHSLSFLVFLIEVCIGKFQN